jgi:hypothetical protein
LEDPLIVQFSSLGVMMGLSSLKRKRVTAKKSRKNGKAGGAGPGRVQRKRKKPGKAGKKRSRKGG